MPFFVVEEIVMSLKQLGLYETVWGHPPLPDEALLAKVSSPHARRTYEQALAKFYWRVEREPMLVSPANVADYLAVTKLCYPPAVAAIHLQVVRELYDEAIAAGIMSENPAAGVAPPQLSPERGIHVPPRDVAARRAERCRRDSEAGRRERAVCLLVSRTAIRAEELQALQVQDYRQEEGQGVLYLRRGEGRQPVRLTLPTEVSEALDDYLSARAVTDASPLFRLPRSRPLHLLGRICKPEPAGQQSALEGLRRSPGAIPGRRPLCRHALALHRASVRQDSPPTSPACLPRPL